MKLEQIQQELARVLAGQGVNAVAAWPQGRAVQPEQATVLVSLEEVKCTPSGLQDYLGQWADEPGGEELLRYGRRAQLTFALDVLTPPEAGAEQERAVLDALLAALYAQPPLGLRVQEMEVEQTQFDSKQRLLRRRCHLRCAGWLHAHGQQEDSLLSFELRGEMSR
ncbi:MAG: hypothetical protein J6Q14_03155 [Oscillospiraceae bacterium]|nr:hypothetical protein [Oscillospiraceae bacterium]MBO5917748.1 hypothetical protein [Oscillospiraceae bacterium]